MASTLSAALIDAAPLLAPSRRLPQRAVCVGPGGGGSPSLGHHRHRCSQEPPSLSSLVAHVQLPADGGFSGGVPATRSGEKLFRGVPATISGEKLFRIMILLVDLQGVLIT